MSYDNNTANFEFEELAGGTIRAGRQTNATTESSTPWSALKGRVDTGVVRDDGSGTFTRDDGRQAYSGQSILATAQTQAGPTQNFSRADVTVCLVPGDESTRTNLRTAVNLGYLRDEGQGRFSDVNTDQQQQGQATDQPRGAQQPEHEQGNGPDVEVIEAIGNDSHFGKAIAGLDQHAYEATIAGASEAIATGDPAAFDSMVNRLSQAQGMHPDEARALVESGYSAFEAPVARMAAGLGIDSAQKEAFYDWCRDAQPEGLRNAVQALTLQNSTRGFKELAVAYKSHTGQATVKELTDRGFDSWTDRDTGEVWLKQGSGQAVRLRDLK